jgi:tryptophanase
VLTEASARTRRPGAGPAVNIFAVGPGDPRRTYTQSHIDYTIEVIRRVAQSASELRGYRIATAPQALRHFTATFAPL